MVAVADLCVLRFCNLCFAGSWAGKLTNSDEWAFDFRTSNCHLLGTDWRPHVVQVYTSNLKFTFTLLTRRVSQEHNLTPTEMSSSAYLQQRANTSTFCVGNGTVASGSVYFSKSPSREGCRCLFNCSQTGHTANIMTSSKYFSWWNDGKTWFGISADFFVINFLWIIWPKHGRLTRLVD